MKAMILKRAAPVEEEPLELEDLPTPQPGPGQIRVKVSVCGVCHTELDEIEGRLEAKLPIILGHEIVGIVDGLGYGANKFKLGNRVGIAWINSACGRCYFCQQGNENLCSKFRGTGCDENGGYAQYNVVSEDFVYPIPDRLSDCQAAPLLCAGAIGYRALRLINLQDGQILGLFGFGASAHIVIQIAKYKYPKCKVFVFTRPGQKEHQNLATKLGADWVGATGDNPPEKLNCAIDFTPAYKPIVEALRALEKGGRVVINAIRKENRDKDALMNVDYPTHLWLEKELKTVANITRSDAQEFLPLAAEIPIIPKVQEFKLEQANKALILLKQGKIQGAGVLKMPE
ncbi:MAG: zinc-dependent alcohol dehydrogenase family protein [Sedimentisphaerales bacterium]